MKRLLKIAEFWYGEETRHRVFEPLLADCDNELRGRRSLFTRIRWWWAVASTFIVCAPRATFSQLPQSLIVELLARAMTFTLLAFGLQWLVGGGAAVHIPELWPPSLATSLPLAIIPVIWRIRVADLPEHQRRLLAIACGLGFTMLTAASSATLRFALANMISTTLLVFWGWRLGDPKTARRLAGSPRRLIPICLSAIVFALFPVKTALGLGFSPSQPIGGYLLVAYAVSALTAFVVSKTPDTEHS